MRLHEQSTCHLQRLISQLHMIHYAFHELSQLPDMGEQMFGIDKHALEKLSEKLNNCVNILRNLLSADNTSMPATTLSTLNDTLLEVAASLISNEMFITEPNTELQLSMKNRFQEYAESMALALERLPQSSTADSDEAKAHDQASSKVRP